MKTGCKGKSGQIAILLVMLLAGLVMLFALNMDIFTSSRSKIRQQNAADASALTLARWQGMTLNLIGELNLAHLAAVCNNNNTTNVILGIINLQKEVAKVTPIIGLLHANRIAKKNGIKQSANMQEVTRTFADLCDEEYKRMLEVVLNEGICTAQDNIRVPQLGILQDSDFFAAIENRSFRQLCLCLERHGYSPHGLPNVGTEVPSLESLFSGEDAPIGNVGISWDHPNPPGKDYKKHIPTLADLAHDFGIPSAYVSEELLRTNSSVLNGFDWCIYDRNEWCDIPQGLSIPQFPWLRDIRPCYAVMGGSATVRVEGSVSLTAVAAQTNYIAAQAAAKTLGTLRGGRVVDISPALILPTFSAVRLVPFAFGANGRDGWADYDNVKKFPQNNSPGSRSEYQRDLDIYNYSSEFRDAAETWYSSHLHEGDPNGCHPPSKGGKTRGGGVSRGP